MMINSKTERLEQIDEKMILISILGSLEAIKNQAATIDEMEKFMFSPHMARFLRERNCKEQIVEIIEKACELEDIASLMPEKLDLMMESLKKEAILCLKEYDECNKHFWFEV